MLEISPSMPSLMARSRAVLIAMLMAVPAISNGQADPSGLDCTVDDYLDRATVAEKGGRYPEALALMDSAMTFAVHGNGEDRVADLLVRRSVIHQLMGDFNRTLTDLYKALDIRERLHDQVGLAEVNNNIGAIHHYQKNFDKARDYYGKSLSIYAVLGQERDVAKAYNNFGVLSQDEGNAASAIAFHREGLAIWRSLNERGWMAVAYLHLGECLGSMGESDSASYYLEKSADLLKGPQGRYMLSMVHAAMGRNDLAAGRIPEAIAICNEALKASEDLHAIPVQQEACECLYKAYDAAGRKGPALDFYRRFISLRDSIYGQENAKELTRIELNHAFEEKQLADSLTRAADRLKAELNYQEGLAREREQRNIFLFSSIGVLALAGGFWSRMRYLRRSRTAIQRERDRSDELLLNILPRDIADELKRDGKATARSMDAVTILFTDFKGFTAIAEQLSAEELVAEIDTCFQAFDEIITRHGIEKIKTIGDAYMAAGGLSSDGARAARDTVEAGLKMQEYMRRYGAQRKALGLPAFTMRVGIHTGSVVAGVVGVKKFQYDIWGDTVNTASRLESSGEVGQVNISESTYELIKDTPGLAFIARGKVPAKGKGELNMYFVHHG